VQFSDSVDSANHPLWQIGTGAGAAISIEDCSGCGVSGWGWQDTATGSGVLGPLVYFSTTGTHTVRVQVREDGLSIDQIVLSPSTFISQAPGQPKFDGTLYSEQGGATLTSASSPSSTLPSAWSHADVGSVAAGPGDAAWSNNMFYVAASGADIGGSSDKMHFAYLPLTGDGFIVARVTAIQNTDTWAKAGVMFRESLAAGSKNATMLLTYAKGSVFQRRAATGGSTVSTTGPNKAPAYWVKLTRSGSSISAYTSSDGSTWALTGTDTVSMTATIYAGLVVSSHVDGVIGLGTFTNVTVNAGDVPPPPPPPTPVVPEGWSSGDIGSVSPAGLTTWNATSGVWSMKGAGADIWGSADAFQFARRPLTGDGEIVARVSSVQAVDAWTKAGVMMRDGVTAGAAHATMFVSSGKGTAFQYRATAAGTTANVYGPAATAPYWVKMVRLGTSFTAYASPDGVTWTQVSTQTLSMGSTINVGLAVTSHKNGTLATVTFDNVTVTQY
jgi:regulation of enolase protein 1 (concanavalin A-like superfamily)